MSKFKVKYFRYDSWGDNHKESIEDQLRRFLARYDIAQITDFSVSYSDCGDGDFSQEGWLIYEPEVMDNG